MSKLTEARLQLLFKMYESVQNSVDRAVEFYLSEAKRVGLKRENRRWNHSDCIADINYSSVTVKWNEYARSCHVAGGAFDIPFGALADDTYRHAITTIVEQDFARQALAEENMLKRQMNDKRAQLAKLKQELGE